MIAVELLIPVADNDGATFSPAHDAEFLRLATEMFGGATFLPGLTDGAWVDSGTVYRDRCRVLRVGVGGLVRDGAAVRELAEFAKTHYRQLAVYVGYLGIGEVI